MKNELNSLDQGKEPTPTVSIIDHNKVNDEG
jgi:hypothetical protein